MATIVLRLGWGYRKKHLWNTDYSFFTDVCQFYTIDFTVLFLHIITTQRIMERGNTLKGPLISLLLFCVCSCTPLDIPKIQLAQRRQKRITRVPWADLHNSDLFKLTLALRSHLLLFIFFFSYFFIQCLPCHFAVEPSLLLSSYFSVCKPTTLQQRQHSTPSFFIIHSSQINSIIHIVILHFEIFQQPSNTPPLRTTQLFGTLVHINV